MLGVMTARFGMMFFGVAGMAVGAVSVVRRLLVVAGFVVLGGFTVMLGGMLVMLGSGVMVLDDLVFGHDALRQVNSDRVSIRRFRP